jgi:ABC-2 type transport system ATP-binding protein
MNELRASTETKAGPSSLMIETHGLRYTYHARRGDVVAVDGIDLRVEAGEVFGFLGPNGAGKTTTLRMLATLLPPTGGEAFICGYDLRRQPQRVRERIGYVAQGGATDPAISGRKELVLQGRLYGMSNAEAQHRAQELLRSLELDAAADRPTGTYSGGQRRRLDLALGLIHRPPLIFLGSPHETEKIVR